MEKAEIEYKKYKSKTLSDVEKDDLEAIKVLDNLKRILLEKMLKMILSI